MVAKEFFTAISNKAMHSVLSADANAKKKITEFATAVVITVQNIHARTNKKRHDFVRQDFLRIFLGCNDIIVFSL